MAKKLKVQAGLLAKVEGWMLKGFDSPTEIKRLVDDISDWRVARLYIEAVQKMWEARELNPEDARKKLIAKAEGIEKDLHKLSARASENSIKISAKRTILEAQKQQAHLLGLDTQRILIGKDDPFSGMNEEQICKTLYDQMRLIWQQKYQLVLPDDYEQFITYLKKEFGRAIEGNDQKTGT